MCNAGFLAYDKRFVSVLPSVKVSMRRKGRKQYESERPGRHYIVILDGLCVIANFRRLGSSGK
jgi:hypothetical protein